MPATLGPGPVILSSRAVLRVLLVDPADAESAHLCEMLAGQPDLRVDAVRNLEEAAARLAAAAYDAALVDQAIWFDAPGTTIELLRERRPDIALVLLTTGENDRDAIAALKLGANDFVSKRDLNGDQVAARTFAAVDETRTARRRDTMVRWLEREARTDHLTGLFNRRAFDERLRELAVGSGRDGSPLTLIVVNVVGTRVVNDAHGYDVGDAMIRRAGAAVARSVRTVDYAARIGGDDFGILLPGGDLDLGCRIARRIAHETERLNSTEWDGEVPVTLTFGLASGVGCDPTELLATADLPTSGPGPIRKLVAPFRAREDSDGPSVA